MNRTTSVLTERTHAVLPQGDLHPERIRRPHPPPPGRPLLRAADADEVGPVQLAQLGSDLPGELLARPGDPRRFRDPGDDLVQGGGLGRRLEDEGRHGTHPPAADVVALLVAKEGDAALGRRLGAGRPEPGLPIMAGREEPGARRQGERGSLEVDLLPGRTDEAAQHGLGGVDERQGRS